MIITGFKFLYQYYTRELSLLVVEDLKDSLKNEVLRRNPPNKNFKDALKIGDREKFLRRIKRALNNESQEFIYKSIQELMQSNHLFGGWQNYRIWIARRISSKG